MEFVFLWLCKPRASPLGITHTSTISSLSQELFASRLVRVDSSYPSVMITTRPIYASATLYASLSSNFNFPASGERPHIPDETSPLLKPNHAHAHQPTISGPWRSELSSFLDGNTGLLLVQPLRYSFQLGSQVAQ